MVVIIVLLLLVIVGLAGFVVHQWFAIRDREETIHFLLEESAGLESKAGDLELDLEMATAVCQELQTTVETQSAENYGLAMENRDLHREVAAHVFCLEMVLTEDCLS